MSTRNVAIITARGGSKRIPRKNIRGFAGKPMINWSIEAALASRLFTEVVVSTDDDEIAKMAEKAGATIPFIRPAELANDFAGTDVVLRHAIEFFDNRNTRYDFACCLYPTAPFITPLTLQAGFEKLFESKADATMAVTSFPAPIFRGLKQNSDGYLEMFWPEHRLTRSQDLPEAFHDAGQFYWLKLESFRKSWQILSGRVSGLVLPRKMVQDIDTPEDWDVAEALFKGQKK